MTFRATDASGIVADNLTPETLRPLLDTVAEFVIVDNPDWGDQYYAQALAQPDGSWHVEVRSGGPDRHVSTTAPNTDATFDILRSWAAGDGWWQQAFEWQRVDT